MHKKPMTMSKYERSDADKKADRAGAKKAGVSLKKWEASKQDKAADQKAVKKINRGKR